MHDTTKNISRYTEVETFDEKGVLKSKIAYDSGRFGYHSTNLPCTITTLDITVGGGGEFVLPYPNIHSDFTEPLNSQWSYAEEKKKKEKGIIRSEIITFTRMNTLKEFLNLFDNCENFWEVYKVIENMRKEYEQLSGINE